MPQPTNVIEFWVVWNPQGRVPMVRHRTAQAAISEAKRLASLNPGQSFYVMKATSVARGVEERKVSVTVETTRPAVAVRPISKESLWETSYPRTLAQRDLFNRAGFSHPAFRHLRIRVLFKDGAVARGMPKRFVWENVAWWGYI